MASRLLLYSSDMDAIPLMTRITPCSGSMPDLEIPMINTMVGCLGSEHRKLNYPIAQLALAATRLVNDADNATANQQALKVWDDIRHELRSHLQVEGELVFSWGRAHHAISSTLLETLNHERQELHKLMATLHELSAGVEPESQRIKDSSVFAQTLLALARTLDSHAERYDGEVLPSILRALFHT
jgi:iron-sulfur cluster repair protein YtfE (RIC family)